MRIKIVLAALSLSWTAALGQASNSHQQPAGRSSPEETVAILLADNGQAPIPGFLQTLVSQLGDDAAVGVIQYLGERKMTAAVDPVSAQEVRRILEIVRMAFAVPITNHPDRSRIPNATLVLLKYLTCLPIASVERADLESTSQVVEELKLRQSTASR